MSGAHRRPRKWTWDAQGVTPALARAAVRNTLSSWGVARNPAEDIILAVSEVVTNAVIHGGAPITATIRMTERDDHPSVVFECSDTGPIPLVSSRKRRDYGRGIALVQAVTDQIGWTMRTGEKKGKTVWFIKEVS